MKRFLVFLVLMISPIFLVGCFGDDYKDPYEKQNDFILKVCMGNNALIGLLDTLKQEHEYSEDTKKTFENIEKVLLDGSDMYGMYSQLNEMIQSFNELGVRINIVRDGDKYTISSKNNDIVVNESDTQMRVEYENENKQQILINLDEQVTKLQLVHYQDDELKMKIELVQQPSNYALQMIMFGEGGNRSFQMLYSYALEDEHILITSFSAKYVVFIDSEPKTILNGIDSSFANGLNSVSYQK